MGEGAFGITAKGIACEMAYGCGGKAWVQKVSLTETLRGTLWEASECKAAKDLPTALRTVAMLEDHMSK